MQATKPRHGRMELDFQTFGFGGGINIQDPLHELKDTELTSAINGYLDVGGAFSGRLGMQANGPAIVSAGPGRGMYRFFQNVTNGHPTQFKCTLMQVGGSLFDADTGQNYGSVGGPSAASMSCAKVFDPSYAGGTDLLIICTGVGGPYVFDGTQVIPYSTTGTTITAARWCYSIGNILWMGGLSLQPNTIAGSQLGAPSVFPGYSIFTFTQPVVGLSSLGVGLQATLVAGLVRGVGLMSGFTPNSFIEQEIIPSDTTQRDGVASGLAMCNVDGYTMIPGRYAIYRYDGATFTELTQKVRPWVLCDPNHPEFPMNGDRSLTWSMQWDRRLYFWYCSNSVTPNTALVYDLTARGWTIYSGVSLGAACAIDAPGDGLPTKLMVADAVLGQQHLFDVHNSADPTTPWAVSDNGVVVRQSFSTKFFRIGDAGCFKRLIQTRSQFQTLQKTAICVAATPNDLSAGVNLNQMNVTASVNNGLTPSAEQAYRAPRADYNIQGEAFSLGVTTPPGQTTPVAPWTCTGITGRISQSPRT